jgi:hypothetical protein
MFLSLRDLPQSTTFITNAPASEKRTKTAISACSVLLTQPSIDVSKKLTSALQPHGAAAARSNVPMCGRVGCRVWPRTLSRHNDAMEGLRIVGALAAAVWAVTNVVQSHLVTAAIWEASRCSSAGLHCGLRER